MSITVLTMVITQLNTTPFTREFGGEPYLIDIVVYMMNVFYEFIQINIAYISS